MHKFEQDFLGDYSRGALIQEIKRVAVLVGSGPLTVKGFFDLARVHPATIRRCFGGWREALEAAGCAERYSGQAVTENMRRQTRDKSLRRRISAPKVVTVTSEDRHCRTSERYVEKLKECSEKLGKAHISLADFDRVAQITSGTVRRHFGSWTAALRAAGLVPVRTWKDVSSREDCLANLDRVWAALGRQPLYRELNKPPSTIGQKAYERIWGTYSKAIVEYASWRKTRGEAIELRDDTRTRASSDADIIQELRRVASITGRDFITHEDIQRHSRVDPRTVIARFQSFAAAAAEAGLGTSPFARRYKTAELFNNLMAVWETLGHRPKYKEMSAAPSTIPESAYVVRFKTWRGAILAFLRWMEKEQLNALQSDVPPPNTKNVEAGSEGQVQTRLPEGQRDKRRAPTAKQKFLVKQRDGFRCRACGRKPPEVILHVDHIIPWIDGGRTILENLQTYCEEDNLGKGRL